MVERKIRRYGSDVYLMRMRPNGTTHILTYISDGKTRKKPHQWRSSKYDNEGMDLQARMNFPFFSTEISGNGQTGFEKVESNIYHDWKTKGLRELVYTGNENLLMEDIWPDELKTKYPDSHFIISGGPTLLIDGEVNIQGDEHMSHAHQKHPRSWVAWDKEWVYFFVSEGRNSEDEGLTATECALISQEFGLTHAQLGDGGGSSALVGSQSNYINQPSDGSPRSVTGVLAFYVDPECLDNPENDIPIEPVEPTEGQEYIILAMDYIRISQARHGKGHSIDLAGKDTAVDIMDAPFDLEVKRIYDYDNTVWAESLNPVVFADGTVDYATVQLTHANTVAFKVGQQFNQGQEFYPEGVKNASGNHIHADIAKGKYIDGGWEKVAPIPESERIPNKSYTNMVTGWRLKNSVDPASAWHILSSAIVLDQKDLDFKVVDTWTKGDTEYEGTERDENKIQYENRVDKLRCRESADHSSNIIGYLREDSIYNIEQIRIKLEGEDAWTTYMEDWGELYFPSDECYTQEDIDTLTDEITTLREQVTTLAEQIDKTTYLLEQEQATVEYVTEYNNNITKQLKEANARIVELETQLREDNKDTPSEEVNDVESPFVAFLRKLFNIEKE